MFTSTENVRKLLTCVLFTDVLCSFLKDARSGFMPRCFDCLHYARFMAEMDKADMEEDAAFLEESERANRFARCLFEDCFCDSEVAKFACFGFEVADGSRQVWKCRRFNVSKLKPDSFMREAYEGLVGGAKP